MTFWAGMGPDAVFHRLAAHGLEDLGDEGFVIQLALALTAGADRAFIDGVQQFLVPFELSADKPRAKAILPLEAMKPSKPNSTARGADWPTSGRRAVIVGHLAGAAGRASPEVLAGIFQLLPGSGMSPIRDRRGHPVICGHPRRKRRGQMPSLPGFMMSLGSSRSLMLFQQHQIPRMGPLVDLHWRNPPAACRACRRGPGPP